MAGRERLPTEPAGQMRESGGSSTGHNRETTGRANNYPFTGGRSPAPPPLTDHSKGRSPAPPPLTDHSKGRSPAPPPLTDHTKGRSPAPPPLTDHSKGRSPAPPHPPEGASKARQIEPVSLPGQGPPAAG
jgi:hypothetical protein